MTLLSGWYSWVYIQEHSKASKVLFHKPTGSLHAPALTELLEINIYYFSCFSMILEDLVMKEPVGEKGNFTLPLQEPHKQLQSTMKTLYAYLLISLAPLCSKGSFCKLSFSSQGKKKSHFMWVSLIMKNKLLFRRWLALWGQIRQFSSQFQVKWRVCCALAKSSLGDWYRCF